MAMHRAEHPEIMWGLGLGPDAAVLVEAAAGPGFVLRNLPPDAVSWMRGNTGAPQPAWITWSVWTALPKSRRRDIREDDGLRRILLLGDESEALEIEQVLAEGFLTAVRGTLTRSKVRDALLRLRELDSLAQDLKRKTDEILLERELLARKGNHLLFLNRVLSRATSSLDTATILAKALADLRILLPLEGLCAAFWSRRDEGGLEAELYTHCLLAPPQNAQWQEVLLSAAARLGGEPVSEYRQICLSPGRTMKTEPAPASGRLALMPLSVAGETFGCLALLTEKGLRLAKDEVQTLKAAVNHLALALRNALLFRQVKLMADRDGLTKIANRRSFEERLADEVSRHGRYGQPLSLILVDVDHFKRVNDTLGHQAGDEVLREVAALLGEGLRGSDYPARYGGEEFAVVLPHTATAQAALLAERIRARVAQRGFLASSGGTLELTVSCGVASLAEGGNGAELVAQADEALYLAKSLGRDRVVVSGAGRDEFDGLEGPEGQASSLPLQGPAQALLASA